MFDPDTWKFSYLSPISTSYHFPSIIQSYFHGLSHHKFSQFLIFYFERPTLYKSRGSRNHLQRKIKILSQFRLHLIVHNDIHSHQFSGIKIDSTGKIDFDLVRVGCFSGEGKDRIIEAVASAFELYH